MVFFFLVMFEKMNVYFRMIYIELLCMFFVLWLFNGLFMLIIGFVVVDYIYLLLDLNLVNFKIIGFYWF